MLFLLILLPLAAAAVTLPLRGRLAAGGAALLVILFARLSDIGVHDHGWPSIATPLVLLLAVCVFVRRAREGRTRSLATSVAFWGAAAVYLALLLASSIWAVDGSAAVRQASDLAKNLLIVYVIVEVFDTPRAQRLAIWTLIITGAGLATISIIQAATHTYGFSYLGLAQARVQQIAGATNGYRSGGPVGDPNFYGLILASLVPLAVLRIRNESLRLLRVTAAVATTVLVAGVFLTYSRGALLALGLAGIALAIILRISARRILMLGLVLMALVLISPSNYLHRVENVVQGEHSIQSHLGSQQVALAIFADHPLLGVGADNYNAVYLPYALRLNAVDAGSHVHDLYLATLAETGLCGLLAFGTAISAVLVRSWRRRRQALRVSDRPGADLATGSFLALGTYLVGSLFLPIAYPRYLWIVIGLALTTSLPLAKEVSVRLDLDASALPGSQTRAEHLRVLHVIDSLLLGGAEQLLVTLAENTDADHIELRVCSLSPVDDKAPIPRRLRARGVVIYSGRGRSRHDPRQVLWLARLIRRTQIDVVHTHLSYGDIVGNLAATIAGRPGISTIHSAVERHRRLARHKEWLHGWVLRWCTHLVVACSFDAGVSARKRLRVPEQRIVVLPNCVDTLACLAPDRWRAGARRCELLDGHRGPLIVSIGSLGPAKGHEHLVEATALLVERFDNARVVIVGRDGDNAPMVRGRIAARGLEGRVILTGERTDIAETLAASDLFVDPSLSQGLSLAALEAMAARVPVVATAVGDMPLLQQQGCPIALVPPGDPAALAEAAGEVLADPVRAAESAASCQQFVQTNHDAGRWSRAIEAIYADVTDETRCPDRLPDPAVAHAYVG